MLIVNDPSINDLWHDIENYTCPYDRRMMEIESAEVEGCNTENVRYMINEMVRRYAVNGVYLEVGTYRGASLLSAALGNSSTLCVGIDNFSELGGKENYPILLNNLAKFNFKNVRFVREEYHSLMTEGIITRFTGGKKIDVYLYDGGHKMFEQWQGLQAVLPYLSPRCVVIVDDYNWSNVHVPTMAFAKEEGFSTIFAVQTAQYPSNWWNGLVVLGRGI